MKVNVMFAADETEREHVSKEEQGPQEGTLGHTSGNWEWVKFEWFHPNELSASRKTWFNPDKVCVCVTATVRSLSERTERWNGVRRWMRMENVDSAVCQRKANFHFVFCLAFTQRWRCDIDPTVSSSCAFTLQHDCCNYLTSSEKCPWLSYRQALLNSLTAWCRTPVRKTVKDVTADFSTVWYLTGSSRTHYNDLVQKQEGWVWRISTLSTVLKKTNKH